MACSIRIPAILLFVLLLSPAANAQSWGWNGQDDQSEKSAVDDTVSSSVVDKLFSLYHSKLSVKQGTRCPSYPSCSGYTKEAIDKSGLILGTIAGFERMYIRENYAMKSFISYFPVYDQYNNFRIYDPYAANNIFQKKDFRFIDPVYNHELNPGQGPKP